MITIDGSFGEGGGQILRTSLALSLVTGKPFCIERIRAGRKKPGLQRQHLTAVRAAAEVGQSEVEGAALGSGRLTFSPREVRPGEYDFAIGTAGSTTLVVQTVLPALMLARGPSQLRLEGGTHNMNAPPFDFLQKAFLPLLGRMGINARATLERPGFYPAGGGRLTIDIQPPGELRPLELVDRGRMVRRVVRGMVSRLPRHIAQREVRTVLKGLDWPEECGAVEEVGAHGPGNVVLVEIHSEHVTEIFTGFGQKGVPAEAVAGGAVAQASRYLASGAPVGECLADQLLLPLALARGGVFRTLAPTKHTETNLETLKRFLDVEVAAEQIDEAVWQIRVGRSRDVA
jgi:RNA 3'-terminal phosphate cyclase (ATP)